MQQAKKTNFMSTSLLPRDGEESTPMGPLVLGNFKLNLFADDNRLFIEGENTSQSSSQFHSRELSPEEISQLTSGVLETPPDLFDFIIYSIKNSGSDTSITISDDAKITISQITKIGNKSRTISYVIQLEPENLHPLEACGRFLKKLPMEKGGELTSFEQQFVKIFENIIAHCRDVEKQLEEAKEKLRVLQGEKKEEEAEFKEEF